MCFFCVPDPETASATASTRVVHEPVEDVSGLLGHLTDHVFTAGIRLTEALEGRTDPRTAAHVECALDELDRALRDMRTAVFPRCG